MSAPPPPTASPAPPRPAGAPPPHVSEGFAWWSPFAALVAANAGTIVLVAILAGATGSADGGELPAGVKLVGTFIQDALLIAAMVGFARLGGMRATPAAFGLRRIRPERSLGLAVIAFVVFQAFLLAWSRLDPGATDNSAAELGAKDSTAALVAAAVLVCVVAPIVEELFFRGFFFGALRRAMAWVPAALVTGLVFGGVHAGGTPAIFLVPLAVLGFVLCALYLRTDSLLPGMGVHAFNNALALGVTLSWPAEQVVLAAVVAPAIVIALAASVA